MKRIEFKDHEHRQLVNDLRFLAEHYHAHGSLRDRIAGVVGQFFREHEIKGRASPAAVPEGALPPLPKPAGEIDTYHDDGSVTTQDGYSAEQVREIARAAVEADRGRRPNPRIPQGFEITWRGPDIIDVRRPYQAPSVAVAMKNGTLDQAMLYELAKALLEADRAQQGEPVDERAAFDAWFEANKFGGMRESMWAAWEARAATKAAAPADADELPKLRERVAYLEAMLDARLERKPDDSQEWAKVDGAIAFHLIERHADDWNDAGRMMDAWRDANPRRAAPVPATGIPTAGAAILYTNSRELADVLSEGGGILTVDGTAGKYFDTMLAAPHPPEAKAGEGCMMVIGEVEPQPVGGIIYMLGDEGWLPPEQRTPRRLFCEQWGNLGPLELDPSIAPNVAGFRVRTSEIQAPDGATDVAKIDGKYFWVAGAAPAHPGEGKEGKEK